jgi:xanthine dehydrogenase molybdopterin binding subunit/xanthine dehydrogenase small subunit
MKSFALELNGQLQPVDGCSPSITLLQYLRKKGWTGTKEGCAEGDCGACSVALLDRDAAGKTVFRAINSCLVPLASLAGRSVVTVEGLSPKGGKVHPIQQSMVRNYGSQCGYCTPGTVMSLFEGYYRDDLREEWQLDDQLCGNLCRCTGYRPIRDAGLECIARHAETAQEDPFRGRIGRQCEELKPVSYALDNETFHRRESLRELLELLRLNPQAQLVAGATEIGLKITKLFQRFPVLISLEGVRELQELEKTDAAWRIGAALPLTTVWEAIGGEFPALETMFRWFGSRQIRNRATLGGNLVTASPIGDSAPVLLALDAEVELVSAEGERRVPLGDFFVGYRKTVLKPGEILRTIVIPRERPGESGLRRLCQFYKVSRRREMDISTVSGCFRVDLDPAGYVKNARLVYGGVAVTPSRVRGAEDALTGKPWTVESVARIRPLLLEAFTPITDVRGSADYRRELVTELLEKFFEETQVGLRTPWEHRALAAPALSENGLLPHESAHLHVSGAAIYVDDESSGRGTLEAWPVCSPHARARILRRDAAEARHMPGVTRVLFAEDVLGTNDVGAVRHDEPLLATDEVYYHGQIVALVVGETEECCRLAAERVRVEYEPLPAILTIREAITANSFHTQPNFIRRGDVDRALREAPFRLAGEFEIGGQDHFYLESQAAWAEPGEDGTMQIASSTQHPTEVQHAIAHVLRVPAHKVIVKCPRMGGAFGGKETQAVIPAALAALAAASTSRPVRVRFNRDQDMMITGKRHPFLAHFEVGFGHDGQISGLRTNLISNGGWSLDLSIAVTDRALFHLANAYYIPAVEFSGRVARTNITSNTAFRGFGGPQGMLVIEEIIDRIARTAGLRPEVVRERNLYHGTSETNTTHFGQQIEDNRIQRVWRELLVTSEFARRREEIANWNAGHPTGKRGIAITPVNFGISFTVTHLNQAGALVLIYQDGSVQVNHGGTEMGQGIHTNIEAIAARELGLTPDRIRVMPTSTDKVPNTSATAGSTGTDLNGAATRNACQELAERLRPVAAALLTQKTGRAVSPEAVRMENNTAFAESHRESAISFEEVVRRAYIERISLSTTGYYRTPGIHYDRERGRGKPFHYFAVGAAVSEVEIDGRTGMMRLLRVDILHDAGDSINPGINRGQVEGGFIQGAGWLTTESLMWDKQGRLLTHSPDTYKIPTVGDIPSDFRVAFLSHATQTNTIYGSKAVGEPPLMLAISVREAIRDAVAAFGEPGGLIPLASPATSEAIFTALRERRKRSQAMVFQEELSAASTGSPAPAV